ncbi:MAG: PIN domain-containing protein [Treponema sp.]|nr:PIN domain-containing protein [Treponema sp.]MBP5451147.1 PIN domain-containing protein [Treponema sp.]
MVYADANVFLRFILNDNEAMADYAEKLLQEEDVFILHEVIAEMVYVLNSVYNTCREDISKKILELLKYTNTTDKNVIEFALQLYGESKLDFVDCILCSYHRLEKISIISFDKKLNSKMMED